MANRFTVGTPVLYLPRRAISVAEIIDYMGVITAMAVHPICRDNTEMAKEIYRVGGPGFYALYNFEVMGSFTIQLIAGATCDSEHDSPSVEFNPSVDMIVLWEKQHYFNTCVPRQILVEKLVISGNIFTAGAIVERIIQESADVIAKLGVNLDKSTHPIYRTRQIQKILRLRKWLQIREHQVKSVPNPDWRESTRSSVKKW